MSSSASVTIPCSIAKLVSDSNAAVEFAKRGRANLTPNFRLVCVLQFDRLLNEELNFGPGARKISLKLLTSRAWALSDLRKSKLDSELSVGLRTPVRSIVERGTQFRAGRPKDLLETADLKGLGTFRSAEEQT